MLRTKGTLIINSLTSFLGVSGGIDCNFCPDGSTKQFIKLLGIACSSEKLLLIAGSYDTVPIIFSFAKVQTLLKVIRTTILSLKCKLKDFYGFVCK